MRLLVRFALAILFCLLLGAAYEYMSISRHVVSSDNKMTDEDEIVRILLMSNDPATSLKTNVNVTFNVIVVLIISLIIIALLVTGIIMIAMTMDSSVIDNENYDCDFDEMATILQQDERVCMPEFLSSADHLLPPIDIFRNLNKYSVSAINEV